MKSFFVSALALIFFATAVAAVKTGISTDAPRDAVRDQHASAAFNDGSYVGKLAAERGDAPHVATSRWATEADRTLYAAGYRDAYERNLAQNRVSNTRDAEIAAFRDGLYVGKLDSENGRERHVAVARWYRTADRSLFAKGYDQSYGDGLSARSAQDRITREASLVH